MQTVALHDDVTGGVIFDGDRIGFGSSAPGTEGRWSEFEIYRTAGGKYVATKTGCSSRPGEVPRRSVTQCESGREVVLALTWINEVKGTFISRAARKALEQAAAVDENIMRAYYQRVA